MDLLAGGATWTEEQVREVLDGLVDVRGTPPPGVVEAGEVVPVRLSRDARRACRMVARRLRRSDCFPEASLTPKGLVDNLRRYGTGWGTVQEVCAALRTESMMTWYLERTKGDAARELEALAGVES